MSDAVSRAIRTALQVLVFALVSGIYAYLQGIDFSRGIPDLSTLKAAGVVILSGASMAFLSWLMRYLESTGASPPIARPATPTGPPVAPTAPSGPWGSPAQADPTRPAGRPLGPHA